MFRLKFILSGIIFISFLITTSLIKNESRVLEKQILILNTNLKAKEKNLSEAQLDFYYLTSPAEIEKKILMNKSQEFKPIRNSKIFNNINDIIMIEKKISNLKNINEKKQKKQTN